MIPCINWRLGHLRVHVTAGKFGIARLMKHRLKLAVNAIMHADIWFLHDTLVVMMVYGTILQRRLALTEEASWWLVRLRSTFTIAYWIDRGLIFRVYSVCRLVGWAEMEWVGIWGYSMLSFSNKLWASRVFLKLQLMHLALFRSLILRRKVPRGRITTTFVENWIQTVLLMWDISFLEDLAIKSSVCPREIIHVS